MLALPGHRPLVVVALLAPLFSGCPPSGLFYGRLHIINATGGTIRSPALENERGREGRRLESSDLADGQAWVLDNRRDAVIGIREELRVSYLDASGAMQARTAPFRGEVPDQYGGDYFVELGPDGRVDYGPIVRKDYHEDPASTFATHTLAGAAGMVLGWIFCRAGHAGTRRPEMRFTDPDRG